jgi:hypothetical protein
LVERRPEKAGVASSILAPGTTSKCLMVKARHRVHPKQIIMILERTDGCDCKSVLIENQSFATIINEHE